MVWPLDKSARSCPVGIVVCFLQGTGPRLRLQGGPTSPVKAYQPMQAQSPPMLSRAIE